MTNPCEICLTKECGLIDGQECDKFWEYINHTQSNKMKKKIYYAHHLFKYNTEIEKYELQLIEKAFPHYEIINPNGSIEQGREENAIMKDCLYTVFNCDALVFSSMSGVVGKGVVDEVNMALQSKKDVYYLNNNEIKKMRKVKFKKITDSNSNRIYALMRF